MPYLSVFSWAPLQTRRARRCPCVSHRQRHSQGDRSLRRRWSRKQHAVTLRVLAWCLQPPLLGGMCVLLPATWRCVQMPSSEELESCSLPTPSHRLGERNCATCRASPFCPAKYFLANFSPRVPHRQCYPTIIIGGPTGTPSSPPSFHPPTRRMGIMWASPTCPQTSNSKA